MSRRHALLGVGLGCVLAGFGVLGYVTWQLVGTNIVSERHQRQLVTDLRDHWDRSGGDRSVAVEATAIVRIPRFGDDYAVPVLDGVDDDNLSRGLAHFPDSADAGHVGNFALAGHRITHGEPLRGLPDLEPGDEVVVETEHTVYTYRVDTRAEDLVVGFDDVWVLEDRPTNPDASGVSAPPKDRLLTLTTCAELFHTDDRMVVFAHLDSSRPRGG